MKDFLISKIHTQNTLSCATMGKMKEEKQYVQF